MTRIGRLCRRRGLAILCLAAAGCQTLRPAAQPPVAAARRSVSAASSSRRADIARREFSGGQCPPYQSGNPSASSLKARRPPATQLASYDARLSPPSAPDDSFAAQRELALQPLVGEVLARNRTLESMRAAWQAALQRYPQAVALDDPSFTSMLAPASLNSGIAGLPGNSAGYLVGGSQTIPWLGKRPLRGQVAQAEASSARLEFDDMRLELTEAAGLAYFDYYLVRRRLALNSENMAQLAQFREIASRKYETNQAPQQDLLQAEVELAELARLEIELERMERIAIARLNTLMHRAPDARLPPPPARLSSPELSLPAAELRGLAVTSRPDLASLGAQIRAEQSRLRLAYREFYPDLEVFGRYDNFWSQASLRGQIGLNMNVPLYREKRYAAAREAQWRLSRRRAEYEQRIDDINREVQIAFERFDESRQTVALYANRILPAARQNVASAFAAYESGGGDFLRLVAAQRQFIALQERHQQAIADFHRRRVELERAVGRPLSAATAAEGMSSAR